MSDYVVRRAQHGYVTAVRYLGTGKTDLEWTERPYAKKFTLDEATSLARLFRAEVERA